MGNDSNMIVSVKGNKNEDESIVEQKSETLVLQSTGTEVNDEKINMEEPEKNRTVSKKPVIDHHKDYSEAIENVVNKARIEVEAMEVEYASTDSEITSPAKKMMLSKSF